jgi:hypothetical protein
MRTLRTSHQHTAIVVRQDHHFRSAVIVAKQFRDTTDPAVNYVKVNIFGIQTVRPRHPLIGYTHPVMVVFKAAHTSGAHLMP